MYPGKGGHVRCIIGETRMSKMKEYEIMPSTLETIDRALFTWVDEQLNAHAVTNKGKNKVPVIWLSAERSFNIKHDQTIRDANGILKLPIISVDKTSVIKDPVDKGGYYAPLPHNINANKDDLRSVKGGMITYARRIKHKKTANIANQNSVRYPAVTDRTKNTRIVFEEVTMPLPIYININYSVIVKTNYQQQMNEVLSAFMYKPNSPGINSFIVKADGHYYEAFMDSKFTPSNNSATLGDSEKYYESRIGIKVQGYIMGADGNDDRPKVIVRETIADIAISREKVALGDINPFLKDEDYREF